MASNRPLTEIVVDLKLWARMFDMTIVPEQFEPGCIEHIAIIDAVATHDRGQARDAIAYRQCARFRYQAFAVLLMSYSQITFYRLALR